MFVINEAQNALAEEEKGLLTSILHSINEPKIAAVDRPPEPTKAYICTLQDRTDHLHTHIFLYLTQSQLRICYSWGEGPYNEELQSEVEVEALDFVENMGFMMDNLNIKRLSEDQRLRLIEELPLFSSVPVSDSLGQKTQVSEDPNLTNTMPKIADSSVEAGKPLEISDDELERELDLLAQDLPEGPSAPIDLKKSKEEEGLDLDFLSEDEFEQPSKPEMDLEASFSDTMALMDQEFGRDDADFDAELDTAVKAIEVSDAEIESISNLSAGEDFENSDFEELALENLAPMEKDLPEKPPIDDKLKSRRAIIRLMAGF